MLAYCEPDITTLEYVLRCRAQALNVPGAMQLLNKIEEVVPSAESVREEQYRRVRNASLNDGNTDYRGSASDGGYARASFKSEDEDKEHEEQQHQDKEDIELSGNIGYIEAIPVNFAGACIAVSLACAVLNDATTAKRIMFKAKAALEILQRSRSRGGGRYSSFNRDKHTQHGSQDDNNDSTSTDSSDNRINRMFHNQGGEEKVDDRLHLGAFLDLSVPQFLRTREREVQVEIQRVDAWLRQLTSENILTAKRDPIMEKLSWRATGQLRHGLLHSHRVFKCPAPTDPAIVAAQNAPEANGGVKLPSSSSKANATNKKESKTNKSSEIKDATTTNQQGKEQTVSHQPIDWSKVFGNNNPIRIEVCSGLGEWLCDRARRNPNVNWIGIEMRYERIFQTWTRVLLERLPNVALICGEAREALQSLFTTKSVLQIFVNYPDPPLWRGSSMRLIDASFMKSAYQLLIDFSAVNALTGTREIRRASVSTVTGESKEETVILNCAEGLGALTIVTDDLGYAGEMLREILVGEHKDLFKTVLPNALYYTNSLPQDYGDSYYNRFWGSTNKKRRYMLAYGKAGESDSTTTSE